MALIPSEPEAMETRVEDYVWMVFGQPGVWKTTFVKEMFGEDRTLFISTDRGTRDMNVRRVECNDWPRILKVFKELEKKPSGVEVLCFDHLDDLDDMITRYACEYYTARSAKGDVYDSIDVIPHGKGWKMYKDEIRGLVNRTLALGVCPVFIAHEDIKPVKGRGIEIFKTMPAVGKYMQRFIFPVASFIGQLTIRRLAHEKGGKKRDTHILVSQPTEELYVKDRTRRRKPSKGYDVIEDEEGNLDVSNFLATFEATRRGRRAKHNEE
jgi:hypothetical protein